MSENNIVELSSDDEEQTKPTQSISVSITNETPLDLSALLQPTPFNNYASVNGIQQQHKRPQQNGTLNGGNVNGFLRSLGQLTGYKQVHIGSSELEEPAALLGKRRRTTDEENPLRFAPISTNANKQQQPVLANGGLNHIVKKTNNISAPAAFKPAQRNGNRPAALVPSRSVSGNQLAQYPKFTEFDLARFRHFAENYNYAFDKRNTGQSGFEEDFLGQFECTYQNCGKILRNNVAFIYHIWAHVVMQKPNEAEDCTNQQILEEMRNGNNDEEERTDFDRLHTCPECLLVQPSPHRLLLHYTRIHKRCQLPDTLSLCNICESVIGNHQMNRHMAMHNSIVFGKPMMDLPYSCRYSNNNKRCRYSFSTRAALIEHFITQHMGTPVLLCPFCLLTFNVPAADRKNNRVIAKEYVRHVLQHDLEKTSYCPRCVIRFTNSTAQQRANHIQQHGNSEPQWANWQQATRAFANIKQFKSIVVNSEWSVQKCLECGLEIKALREHHSMHLRVCANCDYVTTCKQAFARHTAFICNRKNSAALWPMGKCAKDSIVMGCSKCAFRTCVCQKMAEHMMGCAGAKALLFKSQCEKKQAEEVKAIFGAERTAKEYKMGRKSKLPPSRPNSASGRPRTPQLLSTKQQEERAKVWMSEFLSAAHVGHMAERALGRKVLTEEFLRDNGELATTKQTFQSGLMLIDGGHSNAAKRVLMMSSQEKDMM